MFENNDHNDILLIYFLQTKNAPLSSQTDIQFEVVRNYGRPLILKDLVQGKISPLSPIGTTCPSYWHSAPRLCKSSSVIFYINPLKKLAKSEIRHASHGRAPPPENYTFWPNIFSWEPALWTANSRDDVVVVGVKKNISIFGNKQRLLSIEMKTKLVQHVESDWMRDWKSVRVRKSESERVRVRKCESKFWA